MKDAGVFLDRFSHIKSFWWVGGISLVIALVLGQWEKRLAAGFGIIRASCADGANPVSQPPF